MLVYQADLMLEHKPDLRADDTRGDASGEKLIRNWGLTLLLFVFHKITKLAGLFGYLVHVDAHWAAL